MGFRRLDKVENQLARIGEKTGRPYSEMATGCFFFINTQRSDG